MKRYALALALALLPSVALADYLIKDGNGTLRTILSGTVSSKILPYSAPVDGSGNIIGGGTTRAQSSSAGSSLVLKGSAGTLYDISVSIGATSGYFLLFDATSLPGNGAINPAFCQYVQSNGTVGGSSFAWPSPMTFLTGVTAGFSTTGCATLTASATAFFYGGYK